MMAIVIVTIIKSAIAFYWISIQKLHAITHALCNQASMCTTDVASLALDNICRVKPDIQIISVLPLCICSNE